MKILRTPEEQFVGLMGWKSGEILMELPKATKMFAGIHTCFCKPMIIAWLDEKRKVQKKVLARPWRIYFPNKPTKYVYETTNLKKKIKIGQKI